MENTENPTADRLEAARQEAGLSYHAVSLAAYDRLGGYCPTEQTIRTYHRTADFPKKPDVLVLCALAEIYGQNLSDLVGDEDIARLNNIRDLVKRTMRCFAGSSQHEATKAA